MTTTHTRTYAWGTLEIKANWTDAASLIRYAIDGGKWRSTPLQVADARHDASSAFTAVNRWLKSEAR